MSIPVTLNGIVYQIPTVSETGWGQNTTAYLVAVSNGFLSLNGGAFTLASEVNFGPTYGIASPWLRSGTAMPAQSGVLRLTETESISWRNSTNTADIPLTVVGGQLTFNGVPIINANGFTRITVTGTTQTAVSGFAYVLTNVAATTVTLPASPGSGDIVQVIPANLLQTNVIDPGANTISGIAGAMTLDNKNASVTLQYLNGSWRFIIG